MKCSISNKGNLKEILNYWVDKGSVWLDAALLCEESDERVILGPDDWIEDKKTVEGLNFDYEVEIVGSNMMIGFNEERLIKLEARAEGIWDRI